MATQKQKIAKYRNYTKYRLLGIKSVFKSIIKSMHTSVYEFRIAEDLLNRVNSLLEQWDENTKEETNL